jgi:hypothetical protein
MSNSLPDAKAPASSLAARVEALLRDPRGAFCPRPVLMCLAQDPSAEQVVMQVGEDEQGRVRLITDAPLADGVEYVLRAVSGPPDRPTPVYVLDSSREGVRPEDAGARRWINTLSPVRVAPTAFPQD